MLRIFLMKEMFHFDNFYYLAEQLMGNEYDEWSQFVDRFRCS